MVSLFFSRTYRKISWIDLFYPDIHKKREDLIRKNQEILDLMDSNFFATNQLIGVLNRHYNYSFKRIELNRNDTVKKNCDVLIDCMHEIQAKVDEIDQGLKKKLEPEVYEKLKNMSITVDDFEKNTHIVEDVLGFADMTATVAFSILINKAMVLSNLISKLGKIATGLIGSVVLAAVGLGIDIILEAILGKYELHELEKALKEYDEVLAEFKPKSREYEQVITEVKVTLDQNLK